MYVYLYKHMLIHKHMEKKTYCNKKKCRITPWQEKNKNPHSDLKQ